MTKPAPEQTLEKLLDAIVDFVNDDRSSWREKKDAIFAYLKEDDMTSTAIEEFVSWFEGEKL